MRNRILHSLLLPLVGLPLIACSSEEATKEDNGAYASAHANIYNFEFDGEVTAPRKLEARKAVVQQLFYTIGYLTPLRANGRVGQVELSNIVTEPNGDSQETIRYHAKLPVSWPKAGAPGATFELVLPSDVGALDAFNAKYDGTCGKNEYGRATFWHDFRPNLPTCSLEPNEVVRVTAKVTKSAEMTSGKYPEYDRIWQDNELQILSVFGYASAGGPTDLNVQEHDEIVRLTKGLLRDVTEKVEDKPSRTIARRTTIQGHLPGLGDDKTVTFTTLIVSSITSAGTDFDEAYAELTKTADLIAYNGHSGLSTNIVALEKKGTVVPGKYQIMLYNGCNTFPYMDPTALNRRSEANGANDPKGTRSLDIIANTLPSYFFENSKTNVTVYEALSRPDAPLSYDEILSQMPASQVVVVAGEEDNVFSPTKVP